MEQKSIKPYKQLKQKQKAKISNYMYWETQAFWLANQRMPSTDSEWQAVAQKVYDHNSFFYLTMLAFSDRLKMAILTRRKQYIRSVCIS